MLRFVETVLVMEITRKTSLYSITSGTIFIQPRLDEVLKGFNAGLQGMCLHEKRKLILPPEMAYGQYNLTTEVPVSDRPFYAKPYIQAMKRFPHTFLVIRQLNLTLN